MNFLDNLLRKYGNEVPSEGGTSRANPPVRAFVTTGERALADAFEKNAQESARFAREKIAENRAELRAQERESQRVKTLRATTDYSNDLGDLSQAIAVDLQNGKLTRQQAAENLNKAGEELRGKYASAVPPDHADAAGVAMDNNFRDTQRRFMAVLEAHRRDETLSNFRATREGLERRALTDPWGAQKIYEEAARSVMTDAGVRADAIAKDIQGFKEHTTYTYAASQIDRSADSLGELKAHRQALADDTNFTALDPERRRLLQARVDQRIDVLEHRAERAETMRLNNLGREIEQTARLAQRGVFPDPTRLDLLRAGTKGTPYEGAFRSLVGEIEDTRVFMRQTPADMKRDLEKERNSVLGSTGTEEDVRRYERRQQIYNFTMRQLAEDPLGYNERMTGVAAPPLDLRNPAGLTSALRARADILTAQNQAVGSSLGLLRPEEVAQVGQTLRSLPAAGKADLLRRVYSAVGDGPVFNATMSQIAPDSPVTAFAGKRMAQGDKWVPNSVLPGGSELRANESATRMLRGEAILNPPKTDKKEDGKPSGFKIKEADFNTFFNNNAGSAFAGNAKVRDVYYQATRAVYADLAVDASDWSGEVVGSRVKDAFNIVTGGGVARFNSSTVVPPFGMSADMLKERVYADWAVAVKDGRAKVDQSYINYANLQQIDDSQFLVRQGNSFLADAKTGMPLVIDVARPARPRLEKK